MNPKYVWIALLFLAACLSVPLLAQQDATGADTFKTRCAICHGMDGLGKTPAGEIFKAASLKDPTVKAKSNDELHGIIKNGKNKMPQFKNTLTDAQINAVVTYLRTIPG